MKKCNKMKEQRKRLSDTCSGYFKLHNTNIKCLKNSTTLMEEFICANCNIQKRIAFTFYNDEYAHTALIQKLRAGGLTSSNLS